MVETTGVNVPSGDLPFCVVGRRSCTPRAFTTWDGAWGRVRDIEMGEPPVGESFEPLIVVTRVNELTCGCPLEVVAKGGGRALLAARVWIIERSEGAVPIAQKTMSNMA